MRLLTVTRETPQRDSETEGSNEANDDDGHVCWMIGREQGLVGKYEIWLCRQSFRELGPRIGFEKYD